MDVKQFYPKDRQEWRDWLIENHLIVDSIWLIYYKTNTKIPSVRYSDVVDEALCFGWIDSKAQTIDQKSYRPFFTKRKANSVWSKVNKQKTEDLTKHGLMTAAGIKAIEIAKQNGSWTILDDAENLVLPENLINEFEKSPIAYEFFNTLSRTTKRNILQWITLAKLPETKQKRIKETLEKARDKTLPKQFITKKP